MALVINDFKPRPCAECGMEVAHHFAERASLQLNKLLSPVTSVLDFFVKPLTPVGSRLTKRLAPKIGSILVSTGLATEVISPDSHSSETAIALWQEAERRDITMREIRILGLPRRMFVAEHKGATWGFDGLPRPAKIQPSLSWIDNKGEVKKRFNKARFPIAKGGVCRNEKQALNIFNKLDHPVIVKPHEGSGGKHTRVHIETEHDLIDAVRNAKLLSPFVIIEEELVGPVFRATLIQRKLAAVLRRDPPHIIGDGKSTIAKLTEKENMNSLRLGPVFAKIALDSPYAIREMKRQRVVPNSVPRKDQKIFFHFKVNWGVGGTSRDATDEAHPLNKKLFEDIGEYLGDDIVGIDFIIPDIGRSWREQKCGVIECNSLPLIGNHHFPYTGKVKNVAGIIWDMIFPESKPVENPSKSATMTMRSLSHK
jgi:cyanophycin synthetase